MRLNTLRPALLCIALCLSLAACYQKEGDNILPTEPTPPLTCSAPSSLPVTTSSSCVGLTCTAQFSVNTIGLKRYNWTFPGGNPSSANQDAAPSTTYTNVTTTPSTKPFTLTACTSTAAEDPDGKCCSSTTGNVTLQ